MAKVDNITQMIRNAQADAIRKNGTANGQAIQNDTVKFLKESISQQQSAGKDAVPSGQAETPALPEVQDTRTTQQKLDDAKKVYDDYVSSDEYKQNQVANLKAQTDEWMNATIAGSEGYTPTPRKDQKEQQLKAEADYWKAQVEAEENQKVMDADLEELAGWSEQDRRALEQYATGQDVDFYNTLNFAQNGIQVGTAEQNAAGLFEKYGKEKVDQIAESFKRNQSQKLTQETAEAGQKHGDEHAVLSSLGSVATNTVGGVTGVLSYIRELGQRSGRYSTLDPNSIGNLGNVYSGAVRGQVAQNIAGEDGGILRQGAAYLYQGGMTMVDSFARAAAGGGPGGAAALAACNAFSQTVSDASRQGATPEQAYTLGVAVAGVEYLSEKIPMDRVFKLAKGGNTKVLAQAFTQAGIEISTEELSLLGSMAAEAAILQEKSSYKQQIGDLVAGGASYEDAKAQADKAVWEEVKQTALVSGFAGSLSGGGAAIVGNLTTNNAPEVTAEAPQEVPAEVTTAAPVVEQAEPSTALLVDGIQDMTPAPAPLTKGQRDIMAAMDGALGVQPAQQPVIEPAAPQEETEHHDEFEDWGKDPNREGVANPLSDRSYSEVGKRSVKAYMYENPAVKPSYQEQAAWLLSELADSTKGERTYNEQLHYESGGEQGWSGTKRHTSESIAELLDQDGMSYDQIERGLNAIVNDHGQENNAVSKRIEFVINDRLMNGYTDFYTGQKVPGNAEYLNLLRNQQNAPKPKKDIYFHLQSIAPEASFFDDNNNITEVTQEHFTLMDDNSVDLDLTPYSSGINRAGAIIDRFGVLYDFALDGEPIDPGDPTYRDIYVTFEDVERPIPRKINGGSFAPDKKGVINLYSDMREIPHLKVKTQARNLETAASQKESAPVLTEAELAQMAMEDLMGGQEQTTKAVSNPIDSYLNLLRGQQNAPDVDTYEAPQMGASNILQQSTEDVQGIKGTGAAERNFSGKEEYNNLLYDGNVQRDRPADVRSMEVPKRDSDGRRVTEFAANAYAAEVTPDHMASEIESLIQDKELSFDTRSNQESLHNAAEAIEETGEEETRLRISRNASENRIQDGDIEQGLLLYTKYAADPGMQDQASSLLVDLGKLANMSGRNLQMFSLLRRMTPEGRVMTVQKNVARYVQDINKGRSARQQIDSARIIDKDLEQQLRTATTDEERQEIENAIYKDVASQIKPTLGEAWDAWRNLAMLGNAKTHIRNFISTGSWKPFAAVKRDISAVLQKVFLKQEQRTASILGISKKDIDLLAWAKVDAKDRDIQERMGFSGTTGNEARNAIEENRQMLPGFLDKLAKGNRTLMEKEDMIWKRSEYARALAGFMKARGYTADQIHNGEVPNGILEDARQYAIKEAQKATFNDSNEFSDWVTSTFKPKHGRAVDPILNVPKKGSVPFLRAPANIVVRAMEYNPIALGKTLLTAKHDIDSGKKSAADVVNDISAGLTGTAAMGIGAMLAAGMVPGVKLHGKVDDEDALREGIKSYSLQIGNKCYSMAWLAPGMIPLFTGANIYNRWTAQADEANADVDGWDLVEALKDVAVDAIDPILELSMLSSLNDIIDNVAYEEDDGDKLMAFFLNAVTSYMFQGLPTIFGQIEQSTEETKSSTYINTDNKTEATVKRALSSASQRVPGLDLYQTEKLNEWGEPVKNEGSPLERAMTAMFNPSSETEVKDDPLTKEITRLNRVQTENVSPPSFSKIVSYTDIHGNIHANIRLTEEQYQTMARTQGQTSKRLIVEMLLSDDYKVMTDEQKAKAITQAYAYARETAEKATFQDHEGYSANWMNDAAEGEPKDTAAYIMRRITNSDINSAMTSLDSAWDKNHDQAIVDRWMRELDTAYNAYSNMSKDMKSDVREFATGTTAKYLEARDNGVSHEDFLTVAEGINSVKGTGKYNAETGENAVREIDRRRVIANANISTTAKDKLMMAYMEDYEHGVEGTETSELKYQYIRQELGLSPQDYIKAYEVDLAGGKWRDIRSGIMKALGCDYGTANKLLLILEGRYKQQLIDWYTS